MNHSNKDGALSAESEEGRLRLKENIFLFDTYPTQCGTARVPRVGECADKRHVGPPYLREEPDALMSARPGLCGGHQATGVPTAIANYLLKPVYLKVARSVSRPGSLHAQRFNHHPCHRRSRILLLARDQIAVAYNVRLEPPRYDEVGIRQFLGFVLDPERLHAFADELVRVLLFGIGKPDRKSVV